MLLAELEVVPSLEPAVADDQQLVDLPVEAGRAAGAFDDLEDADGEQRPIAPRVQPPLDPAAPARWSTRTA
jgi:hypothetical protein